MIKRATIPPPLTWEDYKWLENKEFAVFVDAGSSGSRLLVYAWESVHWQRTNFVQQEADFGIDRSDILRGMMMGEKTRLSKVLNIVAGVRDPNSQKWYSHANPGLSTFADNLDGISTYLEPLLQFAKETVPQHLHRKTPIYVYGTAGLRLLPEESRIELLQKVCDILRDESKSPFAMDNCSANIQTITGEWEGIYGWLAVNFLGGFLPVDSSDHGPAKTLGFADMGGASTQLCFEPVPELALEHADDLQPITIYLVDGTKVSYNIWVKTWLGHGVNEARKAYAAKLEASRNDAERVLDPCLPAGFETTGTVGTGELKACMDSLLPILNHTKECPSLPCLWNGVHAPLRPQDLHRLKFVGVSEFWYANEDIHDLDGIYEYDSWTVKVSQFCQTPWNATLKRWQSGEYPSLLPLNDENKHRLELGCFRSAWVGSVIWWGLGAPRNNSLYSPSNGESTNDVFAKSLFTGINNLNGLDISWTLGAMLHQASQNIHSLPTLEQVLSPPTPLHLRVVDGIYSNYLFVVILLCVFFIAIKMRHSRVAGALRNVVRLVLLPLESAILGIFVKRARPLRQAVSDFSHPLHINISKFMHLRGNSENRRRPQFSSAIPQQEDDMDLERSKISINSSASASPQLSFSTYLSKS